MPLLKTPAIVLRSRKWGDADRIVTFYTLRVGKVRGVGRGARRLKSRFGSVLEPFVHCDLNLFEKPNDTLYRISQADIREPFTRLREDLGLMAGAARLANLVNAVAAEGDPSPRTFEILLEGLQALEATQEPGLTALVFQIRLLGQSGYRPQTGQCAACGIRFPARNGPGVVRFSPSAGGVVCERCVSRVPDRCFVLSPGSVAMLERVPQMVPSALGRLKAAGQVRAELE
ncbi:MAG: DNA repair protein RecO, partial [Nitrospirales bacterium]